MKNITKLAGIATVASLLLAGCSFQPGSFTGGGIGQSEGAIESAVMQVDGVQNANFEVAVDHDVYQSKLTVDIIDGYYIADPAAFADYLIRSAWSYEKEQDGGIEVRVNGGVPDGYDWGHAVYSKNPTAFPFIQTFRFDERTIHASPAGMTIAFGNAPGAAASFTPDMVKEGSIPDVTPPAIISPRIHTASNDEVGGYYNFSAYQNPIDGLEPYTGDITVTLLDREENDKVVARADAEIENDGEINADIIHVAEYDSTYIVRIEMTPQSGYDTETRQYQFRVFGNYSSR